MTVCQLDSAHHTLAIGSYVYGGYKMMLLPRAIVSLQSLVTLNVSHNKLERLPSNIGQLHKLRYLDLSNNNISVFPKSMIRFKLDMLDISHNNLMAFKSQPWPLDVEHFGVPSLLECAARTVIRTKVHYSPELIPTVLIDYLNDPKFCVCNTPCFKTYFKTQIAYNSARSSSVERGLDFDLTQAGRLLVLSTMFPAGASPPLAPTSSKTVKR
uniref:Uncharacterized protein n=1 Tax=Timema douglasi TaxID=61478 RepID=A0A7R8ZBF5_TIMDO|nr:unnamed protein product [Timema douglasi]